MIARALISLDPWGLSDQHRVNFSRTLRSGGCTSEHCGVRNIPNGAQSDTPRRHIYSRLHGIRPTINPICAIEEGGDRNQLAYLPVCRSYRPRFTRRGGTVIRGRRAYTIQLFGKGVVCVRPHQGAPHPVQPALWAGGIAGSDRAKVRPEHRFQHMGCRKAFRHATDSRTVYQKARNS